MVQTAAIAAACLAIALAVWSTWPPPGPVNVFGPGPTTAMQFPTDRFVRADIARYADGELRDGRLLAAFTPDDPCMSTLGLTAAFARPPGNVIEFRRQGWPTNWLAYRWDASYPNVYERDRAETAPPLRGSGWIGAAHYQEHMDSSGRRQTRMLFLSGLIAPLLVGLGTWHLIRLGGSLVLRSRPFSRQRLRIACGVAAASALIVVLTRPSTEVLTLGPPAPTPTTRSINLTIGEARGLKTRSDGEAVLARAILATAAGQPGEGVLVVGLTVAQQVQQTPVFAGWPRGTLVLTRTAPVGAELAALRPARVQLRNGWIKIDLLDRRVADAQVNCTIALTALSEWVVILILSWVGVGMVAWAAKRASATRSRRRTAAGRCMWCAYDLSGHGRSTG